jgi:dCMP deaminase
MTKVHHWDERFLAMARLIAGWSKDPSTQVGCVVVRPNRTIVSLGYNGLPRGVHDRSERLSDRTTKLAMTIHAEMNAILTSNGSLEGCTAYVYPCQPCASCAAALIQAGIACVVALAGNSPRWETSFDQARVMFNEASVELRLRGEDDPDNGPHRDYGLTDNEQRGMLT